MNILIKLMSIVSLVIAPHIAVPDRAVAPVVPAPNELKIQGLGQQTPVSVPALTVVLAR